MKLVKFDNWKLVITEEALLVSAFAALWKRDKSKDKSNALKEFGAIYFLIDPRSDYMYLVDYEERLKAIKEQTGLAPNWKPDAVVNKAIEVYKSLTQSTSSLLLEDTRELIYNVRQQMKQIDLTKTDDKGKPLYTLNTVTATIKQIPDLIVSLDKAEKAIMSELELSGKTRGQREKTIFEEDLEI